MASSNGTVWIVLFGARLPFPRDDAAPRFLRKYAGKGILKAAKK